MRRYETLFKVTALFFFCLVLTGCPQDNQKSQTQVSQHPTQDEWLEVYAAYKVHDLTDMWQKRVFVRVAIVCKGADSKNLATKEIVITLTLANGEDPVSQDAKNTYMKAAESAAKAILEDYGLNEKYNLTVQFV